MLILGLTGPTGAGKTTVSKMLSEWEGVTVIDCDQVARQVVEQGKSCLLDLAVEFTSAIINADGSLNRRRLGDMVFSDPEKLSRLNEIIFPYIMEEILARLKQERERGAKAVVLDAPTLFESGAKTLCGRVIVVTADAETRLDRIMSRDGLTPLQAKNRMQSQQDERFYLSQADHVIRNDGDPVALRLAVLELLNQLGL